MIELFKELGTIIKDIGALNYFLVLMSIALVYVGWAARKMKISLKVNPSLGEHLNNIDSSLGNIKEGIDGIKEEMGGIRKDLREHNVEVKLAMHTLENIWTEVRNK